ncbi:hypothetical protein [Glycomyces paridis]|uniref:Uncharacterized protein n=1 Tax=Glycomyces paridis TaxID=2126555 RepID=A0A4S8P0P3_9ACTN|nr:hypothetical protein [Glycomyces paridis]THV23560.1 hypothetical protein E9998_22455 [Glycomyces paridis]
MAADYYRVDTEDGDHIDDPSEDALYMLLEDLNPIDNRFLTIAPPGSQPAWHATVSLMDDNVFAVERAHAELGVHELETGTDRNAIARDLTIWLASRCRLTGR